jgi:YgiT-type zinc finger domain-containing protein
MEKETSNYSVHRKDYHLLIDKIPAYVCSCCHQKYFGEEEIGAIQEMIAHLEKDIHKVQGVAS